MMLARRASLLVAFYLLAWAATATAECAWVLWEQQRTWRQQPPATDVWNIVDTFETKAACETGRAGFRDPLSWSDDVTKTFTGTRHVCYPDTVDPRGPKEK